MKAKLHPAELRMNRRDFLKLTSLTAVSIILMPLFGLGNSTVIIILLILSSVHLVWKSSRLLRVNIPDSTYMMAFKGINVFILTVMFLLSLNKLLDL